MRGVVKAVMVVITTLNAAWTAPVYAEMPGSTPTVEIVAAIGHSLYVEAVAFSPDGRLALSGSSDHSLKLWDRATGRLIRTISGHSQEVHSVAFSPDGALILSGSWDDSLKLWNAATGRLIRTIGGHGGRVNSVSFSPDGERVLSGSNDETLKLWDVATGTLIRTFGAWEGSGDWVLSVAFSPDGKRVLSGSVGKTLKLWDAATGRLIRTFEGHSDGVTSVAFSPDGKRLLSGSDDRTLKLWELATGQLIRTFEGHAANVNSVSFSPDGEGLLSGSSDETLKLWNAATGRLIRTFERHGGSVSSVAFSADGTQVLSGDLNHSPALWDVATGKLIHSFGGIGSDSNWSSAISADGKRILSYGREVPSPPPSSFTSSEKIQFTTKLWDAATGRLIGVLDGAPCGDGKIFSPDGKIVGGTPSSDMGSDSCSKPLKLWDAVTGKLIRIFDQHDGSVASIVFSSDGAKLMTKRWRGENNTQDLWDAGAGRLIRSFEGRSKNMRSVAFSPDGKLILSGNEDKTLSLWDAATGQKIRTIAGHRYRVNSVAFSPDGRHVLSGGSDDAMKLWDAATGRLVRVFKGHVWEVTSVAFSPDGNHALSGSKDKTLKLWDVATGLLIRTINARDYVESVAFSSDGAHITARLFNSDMIKIWRTETGELLASLFASPGGEWVRLTPEGFFDASVKGARALSVVRGLEVYSVDQVYQALYRPDLVQEKLAGDPQGKVREAAAKLDLTKAITSGGAPRVEIASPKSGATVADEQINVDASVTDQGGGVGKIEWRVNGVTLGVETRGLAPQASGTTVTVRRQMTLEPGDNRIEIIAYNAKGLIASEPKAITVKWTGEKASTPPRLHVLAVGVNDYWDSRLRLNFAASDAKSIGEALQKAGGNLYEHIDVTSVLDSDATFVNLDRIFSELATKIHPRDVFVFFLAGHGKTVDGRYYFLPYDFRYQNKGSFASKGVGQDRFQEWFARIPARKSVLLYDTCESGSLTGERVALRGVERVTALEKMTRAMGRTVLSASTDDTPALEGYHGHGVFTYVALEALGQAHANAFGLISVTDLAAYIDEKVPELSNAAFKIRQVPQMNIVGSNFPLVRKTRVLPATSGEGAAIVPAKPTHVVIAPSRLRQAPNADAAVIIELTAGTQVQFVETAEGWVLVARGGKNLGYIEARNLARLQ